MKLIGDAIKTIILISLLISPAIADNYIFDNDIRVVSSDESGITFTYNAPDIALESVNGYPKQYKFPSMSHTMQSCIAGKPLLPVKVIPVGMPFSAKPTITIISQNYTRIGEVEVPNYIQESSEKQFQAKASKQTLYKNWPPQIASLGKQEIIRGLKVIKINLTAAKIENGALYKAQSITVRVDYNYDNQLKRQQPRPIGKVYDKILNSVVANYAIAKNWRVYWPPIPFKSMTAQSSFDSSEVWLKLEATSSGIYKISRFQLSAAGIDIDEVDPRELRIFYGGGLELSTDNDDPRPQFREIPIYFYGSEDGIFNDGDYLLFYAESVDRYEYDDNSQEFDYILNHYTSKNVYWLTYGSSFAGSPRRWNNIDSSPDGSYSYAVDKYNEYVHQEKENIMKIISDNYFECYWGFNKEFSANVRLANVVAGNNAVIKLRTDSGFDELTVNNSPATRIDYMNGFSTYHTTNLNSGTSFNDISLIDNSEAFHLDYIDIIYNRWLTIDDNELKFYSPDTAGIVEYRLTNVPSDYLLLDITYPDSVSRLINAELVGDSLEFHNVRDAKRTFYLASPAAYKNLYNISLYDPLADNLRSTSNSAEYIIITHEEFYDQSLALAAHRENISPGMTAKVVKIEDIYNQFSWGLFDPLAIRDFLKYAFENWADPQPSYVVLVGDGHYDYRNNIYSGGLMFIPPYEVSPGFGSDENYVYFGTYGYLDSDSDDSPDMIIGRLPANNTDQMEVMLNKIINYEANPTMGRWRNNIIIAADDNLTAGDTHETYHTTQAETLANFHVPGSFEIQKIYLMEYPIRAGNAKPDARNDLISAFNDGGLIVNWIGHGHKSLWAHEFLFRRVEDMPYLNNLDKLPLIISASCSIGFFDHPIEQGLSEDFIRHPNGGGIASIAATRLVGGGSNSTLNKEIFDQLLVSELKSFGEALYIAKYLRQSSNSRKFMLMGDPALIAGKPNLDITFSHQPDSLTGLTVDSLAGYVCDDNGDTLTDFNGTVWVLVKDASINRNKILLNYSNVPLVPESTIEYILPGPTIFIGPAEIVNGYFSTSFFIPKDVTYGGTSGKIYVYFENGENDGSGVTDTLAITGNFSAEEDSTGPAIEILYKDQSLSSSIVAVSTKPEFEVRLFDEHGINITGSMGHEIRMKIDNGDLYSMDITDNFVFDMGDWQQGAAIFEIENLPVGEHQISLKAWDNYNNSSLLTACIQAYENEQFAIKEVMNYPNPVRHADSTSFQYMLTNDAEKVSLKIFTLAGRKVKSFNLYDPEHTSSGYRYIAYNLRDDDNDKLATGVYIYKIEAVGTGIDNIERKSNFQSKLVIFR